MVHTLGPLCLWQCFFVPSHCCFLLSRRLIVQLWAPLLIIEFSFWWGVSQSNQQCLTQFHFLDPRARSELSLCDRSYCTIHCLSHISCSVLGNVAHKVISWKEPENHVDVIIRGPACATVVASLQTFEAWEIHFLVHCCSTTLSSTKLNWGRKSLIKMSLNLIREILSNFFVWTIMTKHQGLRNCTISIVCTVCTVCIVVSCLVAASDIFKGYYWVFPFLDTFGRSEW